MSKNIPGYVSLTVHELGIIEYVAGEEAPRHKFKGHQGGGGKKARRSKPRHVGGGGGGRSDFDGNGHGNGNGNGNGHGNDSRPFRLPRSNYRPDSAPQSETPAVLAASASTPES